MGARQQELVRVALRVLTESSQGLTPVPRDAKVLEDYAATGALPAGTACRE